MTAVVAIGIALVVGAALGLATPPILRRLPEPAPEPEPDDAPAPGAAGAGSSPAHSSPDDPKIPYASLATGPFASLVGGLGAVAAVIAALLLPLAALPIWLVLGTLGVLLAAVDARTTWLPLPLTRVAWVATAVAVGLGGLLGGWLQAVRGAAGFLLAGLLFGVIWLLTRGGFGFGDVRYAPLVGAATASVSWSLLAWGLVLGSLVGAAVGAVRLTTGRRGAYAYAPSILAGSYLAVVLAWLTT